MASAKHPLSIHGLPVARRAAAETADRDHGRLMPWLVLAAALLALGTSTDTGTPPAAPADPAATARPTPGVGVALLADTGTRAALANALSGPR